MSSAVVTRYASPGVNAKQYSYPRCDSWPVYSHDPGVEENHAECFPMPFPSSHTRRRRHRKRMQRLRTFSFNMHKTFTGIGDKFSGKSGPRIRRSQSQGKAFYWSDSGGEDGDQNSLESCDSGNGSGNEKQQQQLMKQQGWIQQKEVLKRQQQMLNQQQRIREMKQHRLTVVKPQRGKNPQSLARNQLIKMLRQRLEGQLYKYTNVMKGWQYRWFVLEPDSGRLEYFEREELKTQKARGSVYLAGAQVSPSDEDSQTFTVNAANGEIYRLRALDAKERQHWVNRVRATAQHHNETQLQQQNIGLSRTRDGRASAVGHSQVAGLSLNQNNSGSLDSLNNSVPIRNHKHHTDTKAATLPAMYSSADPADLPPTSLLSASTVTNSPKVASSSGLNKGKMNIVNKPRCHSVPKASGNHGPKSSGNHVPPSSRSSVVIRKRSHHKHSSYQTAVIPQGAALASREPTGPVITAAQSDDCFSNVEDMIHTVEAHQNSLHCHVQELPSSGEVISSLDKELLLLKATSTATLACLDQCLKILQQQQVAASQSSSVNYVGNSEWLDPVPLQLTLPVPSPSHRLTDPASPADSFVSASSLVNDLSSKLPAPPVPDSEQLNGDCTLLDTDTQVEDPEEYNDTELGPVEEHKSIILHVLSQLKLGMDLTKVVLPTFILEKRSLLELFADCMAHPDMFIGIPDLATPEERMIAVVEWFITSFHAGKKGSVAKKPYNPIIGETFHCSWRVPPTFQSSDVQLCRQCATKPNSQKSQCSDTDTNGQTTFTECPQNGAQGDNEKQSDVQGTCSEEGHLQDDDYRLNYCAEQVSHHPPVSAFYFECPEKKVYMNASIWTKSKFMGMSIGVVMIGKVRLCLVDHGEEYEFALPSAYARSILTIPWVELGDKINITCQKTGYSGSVTFHTKPFYGGRLHKVTSEVKNPAGEVLCKANGEWNGTIEFTYTDGETKVFDTTRMVKKRKCVRPMAALGEFESRRLWRHVTENLKKGDIDTATQHKRFLEERQRQGERYRKDTNTAFPTKLFHKEGDSWVYNKVLKPTNKSSGCSS